MSHDTTEYREHKSSICFRSRADGVDNGGHFLESLEAHHYIELCIQNQLDELLVPRRIDVNIVAMFCDFLRTHCFKVVVMVVAALVIFEYGFGVFYEENRRLNEAYFTFNLTSPRLFGASGTHNDSDSIYIASANMTMVALQSSNSSDPYALDLLVDSLNLTRKPSMCPLVSPLLGESCNVILISSSNHLSF